MVVTFFGNSDAPENIGPMLENVVIKLIEKGGAHKFYVGDCGNFDGITARILKKLKYVYPEISVEIVLAYMPKRNKIDIDTDTIYPEGLEFVPKKYAITKRNDWMLKRADCVITYVRNEFGNAAKYKSYAEKKGKMVIDLANLSPTSPLI